MDSAMFGLEEYISRREARMRQQIRDAMADDMSELHKELSRLTEQLHEHALRIDNQQHELALAHDEIRSLKEVQQRLKDRLDIEREDKHVQQDTATVALAKTDPVESRDTDAQKPADELAQTNDNATGTQFAQLGDQNLGAASCYVRRPSTGQSGRGGGRGGGGRGGRRPRHRNNGNVGQTHNWFPPSPVLMPQLVPLNDLHDSGGR